MKENFEDLKNRIKDETKGEIRGHSDFQIRNFIIGSQPTYYGKYRQCILEMRARIKNHDSFKRSLELLKKENNSMENEMKICEYEIALEDIEREMYIITEIFDEIKNNIDLSKKDDLEIEFWNKRFEQELMASLLTGNPISNSLVQNIIMLPDNCSSKKQVMSILSQRTCLVEENRIKGIEDKKNGS